MEFVWIFFGFILLFGFVVFWGAPYVPSKRTDLAQAFEELYKIGPSDLLVDIGSGDGVVLRAAASRGACALGYELNPLLVAISMLICRPYKRIGIKLTNYFLASFPSNTTVVYVFSDSRDIAKVYELVQTQASRLGRKLAFISYAFKVPDIKPDKSIGVHHLYMVEPLQNT